MSADLVDYFADRVTALSLQRAALLHTLELLLADPHAPDVRAKAEGVLRDAQAIGAKRAVTPSAPAGS